MKLHLASAVALVGWYLLSPPLGAGSPLRFNAHAPLSQWDFVGSDNAFATLADCKQEQQKILRYFLGLAGQSNIDGFERGLLTQAWARIDVAQCTSFDDPRLKPSKK